MKVPFKQTKPYGCGHYTLANLFADDRYLLDIQEGIASYTASLNKSLAVRGEPYFLDTILCTHSTLPLHNRIIDVGIFKYDQEAINRNGLQYSFRPYFVCIDRGVLHHLVLVCHNYGDGLLYVVDSLKDRVEPMTPEEFLFRFSVQEIMIFSTDEIEVHNSTCEKEDQKSLYCFYEYFEHLKP